MSNIQELANFNNACDEFIRGKYILVDIKINSILNIIDEEEKLSNIVKDSLVNFDFAEGITEYLIEVKDGYRLALPKEKEKIVAFVYSLLSHFKNNEIDFYSFLSKFYNKEDEVNNADFNDFASLIMSPFKNAMNSLYSSRHVLVDTGEYQDNYYNKLKVTIKLIADNIDMYKLKLNEKEEFSMLLNSLYLASEKNDKKMVFSLMIGLDYFTKCNKKARQAYLSLEECFE